MAIAVTPPTCPITLHWPLSDEEFSDLCTRNRDMRFEYTSTGDLIIMAPTSSEIGERNADLTIDFGVWNRQTRAGRLFDSSAGFTLPNGARRSPDVSWISHARWDALSDEDKRGLAKICPDFVLELRSPSDPLQMLKDKMQEYLDNGARLGWLVDPLERVVDVYRPEEIPERLEAPGEVAGEPVLSGFILPLAALWSS
jgi:Uma2 family endonuclease